MPRQYFERQLGGEVLSVSLAPQHFSFEGGAFIGHSSGNGTSSGGNAAPDAKGLRVLSHGLRFGGGTDSGSSSMVAFINLSGEEFETALASVANESCTLLPVDLNKRRLSLQDPRDGGGWIAALVKQ